MSHTQEVSKNARGPQAWMTRDYVQDLLGSLHLPGEAEPVTPVSPASDKEG